MLLHVWRRASAAALVDRVVVATDDDRIAECCEAQGMAYVMTGADHPTGTDRLAEVAEKTDADIYVNVQGDEPLIAPASIDAVVDCLSDAAARGIEVSTGYLVGATPAERDSLSVVHLVPTLDRCVLTFSRLPVPAQFADVYEGTVHVGLYAFTRDALRRFGEWNRGPVERAESIELMRFLERGERIACVPIAPGSIGVDHPEDIARVEAALAGSRS